MNRKTIHLIERFVRFPAFESSDSARRGRRSWGRVSFAGIAARRPGGAGRSIQTRSARREAGADGKPTESERPCSRG
ncbi:hypothetical protein GN956_G13323 [Arapaima gigas]